MELFGVFVGAAIGVVLGSAIVETVKQVKNKKRMEEAETKARELLANAAEQFKECVEPKDETK
jgi:tryptophan synthase alpha subunit